MTAEIGILNRTGVALAADSAVTIGSNFSQKVYNSANKLFSLSKQHPVGIMIYGSANFMGVPWEIIIKEFRKSLKMEKFDSLEEYCTKFFSYMISNDVLLSQYSEYAQVERVFSSYLIELLNNVNDTIHNLYTEKKITPSESNVEEVISEKVEELISVLSEIDTLGNFNDSFIQDFIKVHSTTINQVLSRTIFIPLSEETLKKFHELATLLFSKNVFSELVSGIVIAGYGEKEVFPSMFEFETEGMFCGKFKLIQKGHTVISTEDKEGTSSAAVRAFAQSEMVQMFMHGIAPNMEDMIYNGLYSTLIEIYPNAIKESIIPEINEEQFSRLSEFGEDVMESFVSNLEEMKNSQFVRPIVNIVDILPKEELAAMAEALVNLTSFKRKVTIDAETVGGPIDVAVITKGDGFIWIKRKHYFKPELNYQYFQNIGKGES
ncbi:hypothetical protein [Paenisporosarcina cavernae]|uniref:Uncharacterized protein n=1 Tax=Paenisporosarcina cavernae TaxID=2320858 RepID=A0A385YVU5_9BACL|nr:hypothetical protein [Paenisporosarcina cavernae]AYC29633.1 hypothetical protein D3873_06930 [Paenisporosarcina cavernae]